MKIEKLTENKIRIIINIEELEKNNINLEGFMLNDTESQKFFLEILNQAEKEVGFITKNCKLLIESFSSLNDFFVFTITKFSNKESDKPKVKLKYTKKKTVLKNPIYQFSTFEEFCNLCEIISRLNIPINYIAKKISLYLYNDTYYLVFSELNLTYKNFKLLFSILSEFSCVVKNKSNFEAKLTEYGKTIIKQNAFKTGIRYFV
ncbi:MAG: adaptor protein MecA [Clostridia bacterium]|nr:adaptor protein MecA [Clostridia bacterium]